MSMQSAPMQCVLQSMQCALQPILIVAKARQAHGCRNDSSDVSRPRAHRIGRQKASAATEKCCRPSSTVVGHRACRRRALSSAIDHRRP